MKSDNPDKTAQNLIAELKLKHSVTPDKKSFRKFSYGYDEYWDCSTCHQRFWIYVNEENKDVDIYMYPMLGPVDDTTFFNCAEFIPTCNDVIIRDIIV